MGSSKFLLDVYKETGNITYKEAAMKGLDGILSIEVPGGGFPQRSHYGPDAYQSFVTLNDDALDDTVNLLLKGFDILDDIRYLEAAERAGQFLIRVQGNGGSELQQGWAQQYKDDYPAWARRMEPPAMCSRQTGKSINTLIEIYLATGNSSYLDPIPAAINWLIHPSTLIEISDQLGSYYWSRLYELETNLMIVGNRNNPGGPEYYYDYDPNRDYGYSWLGTYGINSSINNYNYLVSVDYDIETYLAWSSISPSSGSYLNSINDAVNSITSDGFWIIEKDNKELIDDSSFSRNTNSMIHYFQAIIDENSD